MKHLVLLSALLGAAAGCVRVPSERADAMSAIPREKPGEDRLSFKWKFVTSDRRTEVDPQEFASPAVYADTIYVGSAKGWFFSLRSSSGQVRWRKRIGSVVCAPSNAPGASAACMSGSRAAISSTTRSAASSAM